MKRVVCIGSGLAAIYFSLLLSDDIELILVMGEGPEKSNSHLAKGGIAVSLDLPDQEVHIADTITAGAGMCNSEIVREVISSSKSELERLINFGFVFDEIPGREGGHSISRIQHISDQTGKFLVEKLWTELRKRHNTIFLTDHVAIQMKVEENTCKGVHVTKQLTGESTCLYADAIVLASGGCGNLFEYNTNGFGANGEGYGMAFKSGAELKDMEFVQFHPTKMYFKTAHENILVTEAFRGAGAVLIDSNGEEFMNKLHPLGSLAPRDIVSQGIFMKMEEENLPYVYLDFSKVNLTLFQTDFPYLYEEVRKGGFLEERRIPVTPAAHYLCGGISVDANCSSSVDRLFAIGEVACTGLHGANRLASNSLLELFHFSGKLAHSLNDNLVEGINGEEHIPTLSIETNPVLIDVNSEIRRILWHYFGIRRNESEMLEGLKKLEELNLMLNEFPDNNLHHQRLINRLITAKCIADAAIARKESKGCHYRSDSHSA